LKAAKKILLYLSLTLLVLVIAFGASVYLFKDRIIQQFIREANKSLSTPVQIGRIEVSAWQDFPNVAITFTDVYVEDSHPGLYPLLTAKTVSFYINPMDALQGKYSIRGLKISDSETHLKLDENGINNFTIVNKSGGGEKNISFDLRNVKLVNTRVTYQDLQALQHHIFGSEKLTASVRLNNAVYRIEAQGDIALGQIGIGSLTLLENKKLEVSALVNYDDGNKNVVVEKSKLVLENSEFELTGTNEFKQKNLVDFKLASKNTDVQTLLSLFPESVNARLQEYQSEGEIYFSLSLKGEVGRKKSPFLSVSFGCKNASIFHPRYQSRIEGANLEGSFATASVRDLSSGELFLKNISGRLNDKPFEADFSIQDFNDPNISLKFKGALDAARMQNFYPIKEIRELSGEAVADFTLDGKISLLKEKATAQQVHAEGTVELKNISFTAGKQGVAFRDWSGTLQFNKNDIAMSNVSGKVGASDFLLNGFLKNVITYLLFDNQPIGIEADLKSGFLDLDQLVSIGLGESGSEDFGFSISPNLHLNFNCQVKRMNYKRFAPRDIKGTCS
jgi:uncharacterized protein YhdP